MMDIKIESQLRGKVRARARPLGRPEFPQVQLAPRHSALRHLA